jgi:hypothetical protein
MDSGGVSGSLTMQYGVPHLQPLQLPGSVLQEDPGDPRPSLSAAEVQGRPAQARPGPEH